MKLDAFSAKKKFAAVGSARVAYISEGDGETVLLLHGCPFSSFVWRKLIPRLSPQYRCLAPDLLGLGDTETPPEADWGLREQMTMVIGLLDALGVQRAHVVGHDHGGAVAQLIAAEQAERIDRLVLSNVEAYDNWPSADERPFIRVTQLPVIGDVVLRLWSIGPAFRFAMASARAVHDPKVLTSELIEGYIRANLGDRHRRAKTKRFLRGQIDPRHNQTTVELLEGLRRFRRPTLLLWGKNDPHFGPEWGERLYRDIPGAVRIEFLADSGHLVMEEQPERYAAAVEAFLSEPIAS